MLDSKEITSDYVSGLADADGCFSSSKVMIANNDSDLLEAMRDWLAVRGVRCRIQRKGSPAKPNHGQGYALSISCFRNVLRFKYGAGFRMHRKREKLDLWLLHHSAPGTTYCIEEHDRALKLLREGMSQRETARQLSMPETTIHKRLRRKTWPLEEDIQVMLRELRGAPKARNARDPSRA